MARGSDQATQAATSAQGLSNQYAGNAGATYGALMPELASEAAHPAGFNPRDLSAMQTQVQQSEGGSNAGAVGQGALLAGRTKNPGVAAAAIPEAVRESGETASKNSLGIQTKNAALREQQRQSGLEGLQGLNKTETGAGISALGVVPEAVNANTNAVNASWDWASKILDPALSAASGGITKLA